MKNIERKYAYHDDGVFPEQGEDGTTYLTLYSSESGNTYDGWIWDPDRMHYSETERTFGYRYPNNPNYCWDDEVVVDLSNAQTREETSEYATGRLVSFNTNVSDTPIVLQDVDITGMTEAEREAAATTILFTMIPLTKAAYIHAQIEVQMKMNLSPDNTTGNVRVEAFYILNDKSDRTMRPHPINHYTVTRANEYNILPLMYYNPALKSEDHNYIGVKLLVSGGTAEIGISDNPQYGDAIITLVSNGMKGDRIESSKPSSIEISGKDTYPPGYKLNEDDFYVLCTYDDDMVYDVSRLCVYNPPMGTELVDQTTTLTASYQGMSDSMDLYLAQCESIELIGMAAFQDSYTLDINDFAVYGYFDNGDVYEITNQCTFSPAMGTTITTDTVVTATYAPAYMPGSTFQSTCTIRQYSHRWYNRNGLTYTVYSDGSAEITGRVPEVTFDGVGDIYEYNPVKIESTYGSGEKYPINYTSSDVDRIQRGIDIAPILIYNRHYTYEYYDAYDEIRVKSGYLHSGSYSSPTTFNPDNSIYVAPPWDWTGITSVEWKAQGQPIGLWMPGIPSGCQMIGFDRMDTGKLLSLRRAFINNTVADLSFLNSMSFPALIDMSETFSGANVSTVSSIDAINLEIMYRTFANAVFSSIDISFNSTHVKYMVEIFSGCSISGENPMNSLGWRSLMQTVEHMDFAFTNCTVASSFELGELDTPNLETADFMFFAITCSDTSFISDWLYCPKLKSIQCMFATNLGASARIVHVGGIPTVHNSGMVLNGFDSFFNILSTGVDMTGLFANYEGTDVSALLGASTSDHIIDYMFAQSAITSDFGLRNIGSRCKSAVGRFLGCFGLTSVSDIGLWNMAFCENIRIFMQSAPNATDIFNTVGLWNTQSLINVCYAFSGYNWDDGGKTYTYSGPYLVYSIYALSGWSTSSMMNNQTGFVRYNTMSNFYTIPSYIDSGHVHYMEDGQGNYVSVNMLPWFTG